MSGGITNAAVKFRDKFIIGRKDVANWFPGHMAKGVRQMQNKLKSVDCIIEVHDARINPNFYQMLSAVKPRILVLNKADTVFGRGDTKTCHHIAEVLRDKMGDEHVLFTNCKNQRDSGVSQIVPTVVDLIKSNERFNRDQLINNYSVMIIGIPNVGKSSIINALRNLHLQKGNAARVGANPGVTRALQEKIKISEDPTIYLLDTPGIMQPNIQNVDVAMKLALCANVEDYFIGTTLVADYLLYWMNKTGNFSYIKVLDLKEPTDDINQVLIHMALTNKMIKTIRTSEGNRVRHPDFDTAGLKFIRQFRDGRFGKVILDSDIFNQ